MSGQYPLSEKEEKIILDILRKHEINYKLGEVSINISNIKDEESEYNEDEPVYEVDIYVQFN